MSSESSVLSEPVVSNNANSTVSQPARVSRGGFMGGGFVTTLLFLIAFFLVSFSLGAYSAQNSKLMKALEQNSGQNAGNGAAAQNGAQQTGIVDGAKIDKKFSTEDARTFGNKNAGITIVEFSDFQCPFCEKFYTDAYKQLTDKYVKTGKVKIVFKDFPLSNIHPQAEKAAEAARCAQEQGKFEAMHNKLFENQKDLSVDSYKKWASELKLDTNKFNSCLDLNKYADAVKKDQQEGLDAGVQGTPSFVVNGKALVGAQPISEFDKLIESK